jgi:hypothetical protein
MSQAFALFFRLVSRIGRSDEVAAASAQAIMSSLLLFNGASIVMVLHGLDVIEARSVPGIALFFSVVLLSSGYWRWRTRGNRWRGLIAGVGDSPQVVGYAYVAGTIAVLIGTMAALAVIVG